MNRFMLTLAATVAVSLTTSIMLGADRSAANSPGSGIVHSAVLNTGANPDHLQPVVDRYGRYYDRWDRRYRYRDRFDRPYRFRQYRDFYRDRYYYDRPYRGFHRYRDRYDRPYYDHYRYRGYYRNRPYSYDRWY